VVNKSSGNPVFNWWELNLSSLSAGRAASNNRSEVMETTLPAKLQVYPSPVHDQLVVDLNNAYSGNINIQLLNFAGAVQKQYNFSKAAGNSRHVISVSMLPKGEYILLMQINGTRESRKFIKL
jgi:endoglucanase